MLDRLVKASDERIKGCREIERDKLRVARDYNKRIRENHFRSGILFGRQFCLFGQKETSSVSGHEIRKDHIELRM
jgi:hypothetical protein